MTEDQPKKKGGMAIMLAIGKPKPGDEPEGSETKVEDEATQHDESADNQMLKLPQGFKAPASDGEVFNTTIRGKIVDGKLEVLAIGDVPMHSEAKETPEEEDSESEEEESNEMQEGEEMDEHEKEAMRKYQKQREDESKAAAAFK